MVEVTEKASPSGRIQAFGQVDRLHAQHGSGVQVALLARPDQGVGQIGDIDLPLPDE